MKKSILVENNIINLQEYNQKCNDGIAILEPFIKKCILSNNEIIGRATHGITVSYEKSNSSIERLEIKTNRIKGFSDMKEALSILISGQNIFPTKVYIHGNLFEGFYQSPFMFEYFGNISKKKALCSFYINNNKYKSGIILKSYVLEGVRFFK